MIKYIKSFYNFLMKLKQYHATHILIIPPALFFIISYTWFLYINIQSWDSTDGSTGMVALILSMLYYIVACSFVFIALFAEVIIIILQVAKKKKIYVKSKFLLNNKIYNFIYLFTLVNNLVIAYCLIFHSDFLMQYLYTIYLFPWIYLLPK